MTTLTNLRVNENWKQLSEEARGWAQDNLSASPWLLAANVALAWVAWVIWRGQAESAPESAYLVGGVWLAAVAWVILSVAARRENVASLWLKTRLFSSSLNALITLIVGLVVANLAGQVSAWAFLDANFSADPAVAPASEHIGATWGIIFVNFKLFMVGQFDSAQLWRVWASAAVLVGLAAVSVPVYGLLSAQLKPYRR